jgi:hypothetical protein
MARLSREILDHHSGTRRPDGFVGIADHRFGRLVGAVISHRFDAHPIVYAQGGDRFVIHVFEDHHDGAGTTVVMQRPQSYRNPDSEEFRLGHVPGIPYTHRATTQERDDFFQALSAIAMTDAAIVESSELRERLLAEHPSLAEA